METLVPILNEIRGMLSSEQREWDARKAEHKPVFHTKAMEVRLSANNVVRGLPPEKLAMAAVEINKYLGQFVTSGLKPDERLIRQTIASCVTIIFDHASPTSRS